jgi:WD40 repeat protein
MPRTVVTIGLTFVAALGSVPAGGTRAQAPKPLPPIAPNLARLDQTIGGLDGPGWAIAVNDPTGLLAAGCERGTIQLWHKDVLLGVRSGTSTANLLRCHAGAVLALAWGAGPLLASAGTDRIVLLWSPADGRVVRTLKTAGLVRALAMSPDGNLLAGGGDGAAIQLWSLPDGKPGTKLQDHTDWVLCLAFSPDGKWLASGGQDSTVRLWDVAAGEKLRDLPVKPMPPPKVPPDRVAVSALAFSPDGKQLALAGADGVIHLLQVADAKPLRSLTGHASSVTGLAYHPSGTLLVSASKDRTVRLWNPATGQALKSLEGHTAWVQGVALLEQGTRLASVGADQTVRLWDLTEPGKK